MGSDTLRMERRELRHDRHTVSLLTDHMVFSPKQSREILVGDVALALEQRTAQSVSTSQGMVWKRSMGTILFPWVGGCGEIHTESCDKKLHHKLPLRLPLPFGAILLRNARMVTPAH